MRANFSLGVPRAAALACVSALGGGLSGCLGYDGDFDRGYQVDPQSLDQVKVGDTTKETRWR